MSLDLRIRPLGRPKITKDNALGLQRLSRRYVVEGPKVTKTGINGTLDGTALFLEVGKPDEEFTDHYLINQQIEPGKTVDKAYLTRQYAQLRNTWHSEQSSQTAFLKTLYRKYTVLRKKDDVLGYDETAWGMHPVNSLGGSDSHDPWDFLPQIIKNTSPTTSYTVEDIVKAAEAYPKQFEVDDNVIQQFGADLVNYIPLQNLEWMPANVSIDTSNPGVDLWAVSWKLPSTPSWSFATGKGGSFKLPQFVDFDESGFHVRGSAGAGTSSKSAYNFTFFYTGANPPAIFTQAAGGGQGTPTVSMDFYFQGVDGRVQTFKSTFPNSIFSYGVNMSAYLKFESNTPNPDAGIGVMEKVAIAKKSGAAGELVFGWDAVNPSPEYVKANGYIIPLADFDKMPHFQGRPIVKAGGNITWSSGYNTSGGSAGVIPTRIVGSQIKAVHSHKGKRIWVIQLTFL